MPSDKIAKYSAFLDNVCQELDISPTKYKQAVERYTAVGSWLHEGEYGKCEGESEVYPQGSFRLGTVVRPIIDGDEADFDIDFVIELKKNFNETSPQEIRTLVGDRLEQHKAYKQMLEPEGRRCWTLTYSEDDGVGFHMDILPSVPQNTGDMSIAITHRNDDHSYEWSPSNPKGFAQWFAAKNQAAFNSISRLQKSALFESNTRIYASVDDVPDQLVKTPLQRAIQILKRHRDLRFADHRMAPNKPISMVITTLAAELYENEPDTLSALQNIVTKLDAHAKLMNPGFFLEAKLAEKRIIFRAPDGKWIIPNPVHGEENFADRWHENNHEKAKAFFQWVSWVKADLLDIIEKVDISDLSESIQPILGTRSVKAAAASLPFMTAAAIITPSKDYPLVEVNGAPKPWTK